MEQDISSNTNNKSEETINKDDDKKPSVTCSNVPEGLFDTSAAKKHFSKFGRVHRIRLLPKKQMCVVEYEQPSSIQRALLNAGAYDGFMFDVTRTKARTRRRSKKEDDPDWVPDSDVEEELSAMGGISTYRIPRQKAMEIDAPSKVTRLKKQPFIRKKDEKQIKPTPVQPPPVSGRESPVIVTAQTTLSTTEAALEIHQLRSKVSLTPDEKWRILDARDRILRSWGGAGSRVKAGGATIGTCPDMCPEKELLHRQAEHQVMTLETIADSDGLLEPWRAVKQYSRSSADQEIPMCYELRPASVLMRTCAYLLHEIADTTRQVGLADWFHFMWDRLRGIRKDITQQALCCADTIHLVEMCARFHAHCAARLADLEHTQFDQKLNTDNLTKCLQTLKHMYSDVSPEQKPREAEFRGYIALLNLGDANFWWEIKQLPNEIQKSEPIIFAVKVFTALDNNNYVRFFRLVRDEATYLQACVLLRYFNDVRARALARIVKAYAPRGGSKYPANDLMNSLAFESIDSMKSFVNHYGLRFSKNDFELTLILDRNQFIEDSDPYPIARALNLIESKQQKSVAEIISGSTLPKYDYKNHALHTSFNPDGRLKESSLIAEDLGYNTRNDSNKDITSLRMELQRLNNNKSGKGVFIIDKELENKKSISTKSESPKPSVFVPTNKTNGEKTYSFQPGIPIELPEVIKASPEKLIDNNVKSAFRFSEPQNTETASKSNLFLSSINKNVCSTSFVPNNNNKGFETVHKATPQNIFKSNQNDTVFKKPLGGSVFSQPALPQESEGKTLSKNLFANANTNVFAKRDDLPNRNIFANTQSSRLFSKPADANTNIFAKTIAENKSSDPSNVFRTFANSTNDTNIFSKGLDKPTSVSNGDTVKLSPGTLFKQANDPFSTQNKTFSVFQSKTVAENIFNKPKTTQANDIYEFHDNDSSSQNADQMQQQLIEKQIQEEVRKEQEKIRIEEEKRKESERKQDELRREEEIRKQEEARRKQEETRRKQEELKKIEEMRKKEEQTKQEELRKKLEEEHQTELKRKALEQEKIFKEKVEKESREVHEELLQEISTESVESLLKEEMEKFKNLVADAKKITDEILSELIEETCNAELRAEIFWTKKVMKKWFHIWRKQIIRNFKRRRLLEDTPVWLTDKTPLQEAKSLRRLSEKVALAQMNAFHRGYIFSGELREIPPPQPFNIVDIIRSPLLKRMKYINYPYDKCFFWKTTIVSPGASKWFCKKVNIQKWLLDAFELKGSETMENYIHTEKQTWNNLMDFATSITLINQDNPHNTGDALEGTNGIIFYMCNDVYDIKGVENILNQKYPYHMVPIAIITTQINNTIFQNDLQIKLTTYVKTNIISDFRIFVIDSANVANSLDVYTKSALKWLAKRCPKPPPLEIDSLKSICQRCLGNEIWHRLKTATDTRTQDVMNDIQMLVQYYNIAVDKLINIITDEDLFNYPSFPVEFKDYLDSTSPYPKPYEFIPSNVKHTDNINAVKNIMNNLKLCVPTSTQSPKSVLNMQDQVRQYCNQIGWFQKPESVNCNVVSLLPQEFHDNNIPCDQFIDFFEQYNVVDIVNIIVYDKINILKNFENRYVIYDKTVMDDYHNVNWLYDIDIITSLKHKTVEYEDNLDYYIKAKRRKLNESIELLQLEDKDYNMVEKSIQAAERSISECNKHKNSVIELEKELDERKKKSEELENVLRAALNNV
ncbi:protein xmas-2-like [Zerene cesonia]|uniref:protein xmas-2-like n=1 Tax=Zerene cesonia TaxID=33412 RepID=UPI0018E51EDE|nr:protein xmas-2-like [Zerene cesonia]